MFRGTWSPTSKWSIDFNYNYDLEEGLNTYQEFTVRQLSFSGMLVETDPMPEVDAVYDLEVHLDRLTLRTRGRVIHAKRVPRDAGSSICEAGVAFPDLEPDSQQALEEMVSHFLE